MFLETLLEVIIFVGECLYIIKIALPNKSIVALMAKVLQCNMALLLTHALKCQQLRKSKVVMVTIKVALKKYCGEPYDIVPDMPEVCPLFE